MVEFGHNGFRSLNFRFGVALTLTTSAYITHLLGQTEQVSAFIEEAEALSRSIDSKVALCHMLIVRVMMALDHGAPTNPQLPKALVLGRCFGIADFPGWHNPAVTRLAAHVLTASVETNYVAALVRKRRLRAPITHMKHWPQEIELRVLEAFGMSCSGEPLVQSGKGNQRTLNTLEVIVVYGGREVAIDHLSAVLWPDADGDNAKGAFDVTIRRPRKLLDNTDAIVVNNGKVGLSMHLCGLDLWTFQAHRQITLDLAKTSDPDSDTLLTAALDMLAIYTGDFPADEVEQLRLLPQRERLRAELVRTMLTMREKLETLNAPTSATTVYQRAFRLHPTAEGICRHLLECLRAEGRSTETSAFFTEWQHTLRVVCGAAPSPSLVVMLDWTR